MNCQTFEETINVLAREQMMDAGLRESALAHAGGCELCAARLADERALSSKLRLVAGMETAGAPFRVEEQLMAAFDAQALAPSRSRVNRWIYAAGAVAAGLLLVVGIGAMRRRTVTPSKAPDKTTVATVVGFTPAAPPIESPVAPGAEPSMPSPVKANLNRRRHPPIANDVMNPANKEVATDFMPVMYNASGVTGYEPGSQIVRVEVPRSVMASFGLPVNMARADERVKADVLLGVDGLAHAIRFVQ